MQRNISMKMKLGNRRNGPTMQQIISTEMKLGDRKGCPYKYNEISQLNGVNILKFLGKIMNRQIKDFIYFSNNPTHSRKL